LGLFVVLSIEAGTQLVAMAGYFKRLMTSDAGSVLPIVAVSVPVIVALIGGGLDINRVYKARNRLQSACDAGTLAGRKAVTTNGYDATAQNQASSYFNTNFVEDELGATGTTFTSTSSNNGGLVTGTASTSVQTPCRSAYPAAPRWMWATVT
jgi:Flp pilus assembly protein TadG